MLFQLSFVYSILVFRPKKKLFVSCNPTLTSFYSKESLPYSIFSPPDSQSSKNMHKMLIFEQKNNKFRPTYPIFLQTVTGNKQLFFLGLTSYTFVFAELLLEHVEPLLLEFCVIEHVVEALAERPSLIRVIRAALLKHNLGVIFTVIPETQVLLFESQLLVVSVDPQFVFLFHTRQYLKVIVSTKLKAQVTVFKFPVKIQMNDFLITALLLTAGHFVFGVFENRQTRSGHPVF